LTLKGKDINITPQKQEEKQRRKEGDKKKKISKHGNETRE